MGARSAFVLLVVTAGCRQLLGLHDLPGPLDAPEIDAPDAGPCQTLGPTCAGPDTLRTCTTLGQPPTDTQCSWGCNDTGGSHCGVLAPSGGGVVPGDLALSGLGTVTLNGTIISDDGSILGVRNAGTGTISGVEFHLANNVAVYVFDSLTINPGTNVTLQGTHPIALVALHDLTLQMNATIDASDCQKFGSAAVGGGAGGNPGGAGGGMGAGGAGTALSTTASGGGGGAYGGSGGQGGKSALIANNPAGGAPFGGPAITILIGGGGGGGGGNANGGTGGNGGGAIQLVANQTITLDGTINAGGCGGRRGGGAGNSGGGGGGAGGTILVESHDLVFGGFLAVNGGGGGGGGGGGNGQDATATSNRATGADGAGRGGATGALDGEAGLDRSQTGDGGGGGVGRIRLETRTGTYSGTGGSSPTLNENPTTATVAPAPTQ